MATALLGAPVNSLAPSEFVQWIDIMGINSLKVPAVKALGLISLYLTGSDGIEASAAERLRFIDAEVGIIWIDQTSSLSVLASGLGAVGDIEAGAGTFLAAANAAKSRAKRGQHTTFYISQDPWQGFKDYLAANGVNMSLVNFGIANYNDSEVTAEEFMSLHPDVVYVQYGDNVTNRNTVVPGTNPQLTLGDVSADIDVGRYSWAKQFYPVVPVPPTPPPHHGLYEHELAGRSFNAFATLRGANGRAMAERSIPLWDQSDWTAFLNTPLHVAAFTENP